MIIHGGIDENDNYLDDCYLLNLSPLKWNFCSISTETEHPRLAFHSSCVVLPQELKYNPKFNIYKFPDTSVGRRSYMRIKEKGLYLFGGKDAEHGKLQNDVWVLRLGRKPLEWIKLETSGIKPCPRYLHTMNYYEDGNYVIIHGGRSDLTDSYALGDTYILELNRLEWLRVDIVFDNLHTKVYNRCGHSSIIYSKYLIKF